MSPINLTAEAYTIPFQGHELHARVFRPAAPAIGRIFYLHGGGLVFGEPDDLPLCYVNLFLNAGYELISRWRRNRGWQSSWMRFTRALRECWKSWNTVLVLLIQALKLTVLRGLPTFPTTCLDGLPELIWR